MRNGNIILVPRRGGKVLGGSNYAGLLFWAVITLEEVVTVSGMGAGVVRGFLGRGEIGMELLSEVGCNNGYFLSNEYVYSCLYRCEARYEGTLHTI